MRFEDFRTFICTLLLAALVFGGLNALQQARADEGHFVSAYHSGIYAYRRGDYDKALTYLRQAQAQAPNNPDVRYYMAVVLDKLSRPDEAMLHYQYVSANGSDDRVRDYSRRRLKALALTRPAADVSKTVFVKEVSGRGQVAVPLKPHNNALMVEAVLNRKVSGTFIVDTGATYTSISQELYESLDPATVRQIGTVKITTANGRIEVPKILIDRVTINGLEARDVEATVIEVREGSSFSGLLGLSFIRQFKLTIDPQEGHLVFQTI